MLYVQRPGGSTWEGRTAEAAQARARQDYVAVTRVRDAVDTAARQLGNTISSTLMPPLANAKQIIENADASPGVHVNEDLSISYTPPQGTSKEAADANAKTVAAAEAELKSEAAKWWAAELDVANQIRQAESTVVKDLNVAAALYDPQRAMPGPGDRQHPRTQQAVFPPIPKEPASGPGGLSDLLGAEPGTGPPGLPDMLVPAGPGGRGDGQHQPRDLTDMLNQLSQPGTAGPRPPAPAIPAADVEAFKAMARDVLRRDGVPPDQIEQRLNTFVTRAQEGYGLMGNRVPQPEGRGPGPGFGDGFADTWFGFEQMVHNLTGQGGPGAPGVLESWAGLAEGAAEAIVKPPIAGIVEDALNSPNPAYFLGGKTAEAAITAPSMVFGPEALAARGGLAEVEGAGGFGATGGLHLPPETPIGTDRPGSLSPLLETHPPTPSASYTGHPQPGEYQPLPAPTGGNSGHLPPPGLNELPPAAVGDASRPQTPPTLGGVPTTEHVPAGVGAQAAPAREIPGPHPLLTNGGVPATGQGSGMGSLHPPIPAPEAPPSDTSRITAHAPSIQNPRAEGVPLVPQHQPVLGQDLPPEHALSGGGDGPPHRLDPTPIGTADDLPASTGEHPHQAPEPPDPLAQAPPRLPPPPDTFDPSVGSQYTSGDPHHPGEYPPHTPVATREGRNDPEPGWENMTRKGKGFDYQVQTSGVLPTPDGKLPEWVEINPETGNPVAYDSRFFRGPQEVLLDAKDGYADLVEKPDKPWSVGMATGIIDQARRQLAALPDHAILEWHVSNPASTAMIRRLLEENGFFDITVIYTPKLP